MLTSCYNPNIGIGKQALPTPAGPADKQRQYAEEPHDKYPPKPISHTLTTADKHPITFTFHNGQWQAEIKEYASNGFWQHRQLPVFFERGLTLQDVVDSNPAEQKQVIHLCASEEEPDQPGYVYVGRGPMPQPRLLSSPAARQTTPPSAVGLSPQQARTQPQQGGTSLQQAQEQPGPQAVLSLSSPVQQIGEGPRSQGQLPTTPVRVTSKTLSIPSRETPRQCLAKKQPTSPQRAPSRRALSLRNQHELLHGQRTPQAKREQSAAMAKPGNELAQPAQSRQAIVATPTQPPSLADKAPQGIASQVFLAQGGHPVRFMHQDGQWWARVNEHLPIAFPQRVDLPVYCQQGLSVEEVDKHDTTWHKHRIHVCFPEQAPDHRGYVYVGSIGLKGGAGIQMDIEGIISTISTGYGFIKPGIQLDSEMISGWRDFLHEISSTTASTDIDLDASPMNPDPGNIRTRLEAIIERSTQRRMQLGNYVAAYHHILGQVRAQIRQRQSMPIQLSAYPSDCYDIILRLRLANIYALLLELDKVFSVEAGGSTTFDLGRLLDMAEVVVKFRDGFSRFEQEMRASQREEEQRRQEEASQREEEQRRQEELSQREEEQRRQEELRQREEGDKRADLQENKEEEKDKEAEQAALRLANAVEWVWDHRGQIEWIWEHKREIGGVALGLAAVAVPGLLLTAGATSWAAAEVWRGVRSKSTSPTETQSSEVASSNQEGQRQREEELLVNPSGGGNGRIKFGPSADASVISDYSRDILKDIGTTSGNDLIYITSTARGPAEQARAMFNNLERDLAQQRRVYRAPGQAVIDVYVTMQAKGASSAEIQAAMTNKINELGPSTVSRHAANPSILNVIDISIRRLAHPEEFRRAIEAYPDIRLLNENEVFHIEIPQPQKTDKK